MEEFDVSRFYTDGFASKYNPFIRNLHYRYVRSNGSHICTIYVPYKAFVPHFRTFVTALRINVAYKVVIKTLEHDGA